MAKEGSPFFQGKVYSRSRSRGCSGKEEKLPILSPEKSDDEKQCKGKAMRRYWSRSSSFAPSSTPTKGRYPNQFPKKVASKKKILGSPRPSNQAVQSLMSMGIADESKEKERYPNQFPKKVASKKKIFGCPSPSNQAFQSLMSMGIADQSKQKEIKEWNLFKSKGLVKESKRSSRDSDGEALGPRGVDQEKRMVKEGKHSSRVSDGEALGPRGVDQEKEEFKTDGSSFGIRTSDSSYY